MEIDNNVGGFSGCKFAGGLIIEDGEGELFGDSKEILILTGVGIDVETGNKIIWEVKISRVKGDFIF